jgi:hypothetical protein
MCPEAETITVAPQDSEGKKIHMFLIFLQWHMYAGEKQE